MSVSRSLIRESRTGTPVYSILYLDKLEYAEYLLQSCYIYRIVMKVTCQISSWSFALPEILQCDHVHAVCWTAEVMVTYVCVQTDFACALEKAIGDDVKTQNYDSLATDSCVSVLIHDVVVKQRYHDLHYASFHVEISIWTYPDASVTFCFCLEMMIEHDVL